MKFDLYVGCKEQILNMAGIGLRDKGSRQFLHGSRDIGTFGSRYHRYIDSARCPMRIFGKRTPEYFLREGTGSAVRNPAGQTPLSDSTAQQDKVFPFWQKNPVFLKKIAQL